MMSESIFLFSYGLWFAFIGTFRDRFSIGSFVHVDLRHRILAEEFSIRGGLKCCMLTS